MKVASGPDTSRNALGLTASSFHASLNTQMQRSKHAMDDTDKGTALLQAPMSNRDHTLQFSEELLVERESSRRALACRVVAAGFGILFIVLFCLKAVTESADQRRAYSSSCMHALGGGVTGPRGNLLHFDPRCTEELKEYFDQAYYSEVRRVSDQAIAYFRQQVIRHQQQEALGVVAPGSSLGTVIFDIDETALSNMDGFFGPSSWSRLWGGQSPDRCVRPHLEYSNLEPLRLQLIGQTGQLAAMQAPRRPLCYAPPLRPTLDLYNYLYDNNFTVVFLTGRSEDARTETEANLADAGYGRKCGSAAAAAAAATGSGAASLDSLFGAPRGDIRNPRRGLSSLYGDASSTAAAASDTSGDSFASGTAGTAAAQTTSTANNNPTDTAAAAVAAANTWAGVGTAAAAGGESGDPSSSSSASGGAASADASSSQQQQQQSGHPALPFAGLFSPPASPAPRCYVELLMREVGDDRLASVFKSEARSRLVAGGHVLVGNIGDQFSDLVGQASATANFKLPNPVYTLL